MHLSATSIESINKLIKETVKNIERNLDESLVTDIYLYPNPKTGVISAMDDEDNILSSVDIEEWSESADDDEFYEKASKDLSELLTAANEDKRFENLRIIKPYSFILVDEDGEVVKDLLLVDDDLLIVNDELLRGLDQELDDFLAHLLED